jgi:hypothetical protein
MHLDTPDTCAEEVHGRAPGGVSLSLSLSLILENCVTHYKKKWVKHDSRQKKSGSNMIFIPK